MNNELQDTPGNNRESQPPTGDQNSHEQEVIISLPRTERPEGPFEHSVETSGQTKAEEAEKADAENE